MSVIVSRRRASDFQSPAAGADGSLADAGTQPRLLERDVFLSELRALLSDDGSRPAGAVVFEGRPGVGKSALLGAACAMASDMGWAVLRAGGDPAAAGAPYGLLRELLAFRGERISGTEPPAAVVDRLEELTRELAASRGVVFAVDDGRWVDDESIDWLSRLPQAPMQGRFRLLLAASARTPGSSLRPVDWIIAERSARVMPLGPLSTDAVARLVESYFAEAPEAGFVRACHDASGGNPALLFALLRELSLERIRPVAGFTGRVEVVTSSAVARSVLARLSLVQPEAARLLEVVAVAGVPIELDLAAEVLKMDLPRVSAAAEALARVDLAPPDRLLSLQPALVRRTVLAEIPAGRRSRLHAAVAQGLRARWAPVEQLAEHLFEGDPGPDDWAAGILEDAGTRALAHGAPEQAVRYLSRALLLQRSTGPRLEILLKQARAEALVDPPVALQHLRFAVDRGVAPVPATDVALEVARAFTGLGRGGETGPVLAEVASLPGADQSAAHLDLLVAALLVHRNGPLPAGPLAALRDLVGPRRRLRSAAHRRGLAALAVVDGLRAQPHGGADLADQARRALTGSDLVVDDPLVCELWGRVLLALARAGGATEAEHLARSGQQAGRDRHLEAAEHEHTATLGQLLALQGDLRGAERELRSALADGRPWARRPDVAGALLGALLDAGRLTQAEDLLVAWPDALLLDSSPLDAHLLLEQRGRLRRLQRDWSEALCDLLRAGQWADERQIDSPTVTTWRAEAALAFAEVGRPEEATRLAGEHLELARAHGVAWAVGSALLTLAAVSPDDERPALYEEALAHLQDTPARLALARAQVDLGRLLRARGSAGRARTLLHQGADLAMQLGCPPLQNLAMAELRLTGARPRRPALRGADALTSAERRVATLAAEGRTNAEIAKELFLADKTVEGHLFRVFRKLGATSRRQLVVLLDPAAPEDGRDRRVR